MVVNCIAGFFVEECEEPQILLSMPIAAGYRCHIENQSPAHAYPVYHCLTQLMSAF